MRLDAAAQLNATCVRCHEAEAAEWKASFHARAGTEPAFQQAFMIEKVVFCRGCHVPEADPAQEPSAAVLEVGVGCVTCHVVEPGTVLAGLGKPGGSEAGCSTNRIVRSADFAAMGACQGCHEFRFPVPEGGDGDEYFMQTTVREHARMPTSSLPCASCHMPEVGGHRSHRFGETRDRAWLASRLDVSAERTGKHGVRLWLRQTLPGHGFPTGDLFRRLEVGAEVRDADGKVVDRQVRYLARHFDIVAGNPVRQLTLDDRIFGEAEAIDLDFGQDATKQGVVTSWWVTYQRVATPGTGWNPSEAKVESEVKLHTGELR